MTKVQFKTRDGNFRFEFEHPSDDFVTLCRQGIFILKKKFNRRTALTKLGVDWNIEILS